MKNRSSFLIVFGVTWLVLAGGQAALAMAQGRSPWTPIFWSTITGSLVLIGIGAYLRRATEHRPDG